MASGDALAVMGQTGNAAGGYDHCHLEVRAAATGKGLDPTAYSGTANAPGTYGDDSADAPAAAQDPAPRLQVITIGPVSQGDADAVLAVCRQRGLDKQGLYTSRWV